MTSWCLCLLESRIKRASRDVVVHLNVYTLRLLFYQMLAYLFNYNNVYVIAHL